MSSPTPTSYIGKWHLYANELGHHDEARNSFVPPGPHRLGFDGEWKAYNFHHENFGTYYHTNTPEKIYYGDGVYEPDAQIDLAIDFLRRSSSGDEPFAMFISLGVPHDPWDRGNVPRRFWDMHARTGFPNPPNYVDHNDAPYADAWACLSDDDRAVLPEWRRGYYAQVTSLDWAFARLLSALRKSSAADNTIVIFTSDHGELFGAHGRRAKNIFYEEACRIPMLLRAPGVDGFATDVCLSTVDVLPTLLGLMGLDAPADVEGMDLSHIVRRQPGPEPDFGFLQICGATADWVDGHEWRAARDKRYTYAVYRVDGKELLFDHVDDPYQMRNLAGEKEFREVVEGYRKKLKAKMASIGDTFEACTWYRDQWTDGHRNIVRSATSDWSCS